MFCFFESSDGHLTRDGRKPLQKVFECFSALQVIEQRLDGHTRTAKHRSSAKNIGVFDDDSHEVIVSRAPLHTARNGCATCSYFALALRM